MNIETDEALEGRGKEDGAAWGLAPWALRVWVLCDLCGLPLGSRLGTHSLRLLGPKTILYKAFGLF